MKTTLLFIFAAVTLFAAAPSMATTPAAAYDTHDRDDHRQDRDHDGRDDRSSKYFNYGYDRSHRVTPQERARWEAAHRNDGRR